MQLSITLTIAAAAAIINIWLMVRCGLARGKEKVSVGDGGNEFVIRRMRAHSNFIESAPIVLILIAALEYTGGTSTWLWIVGVVYILVRLAHPLGMDGNFKAGRAIGATGTMLVLLGLAVMALISVYSKLGG